MYKLVVAVACLGIAEASAGNVISDVCRSTKSVYISVRALVAEAMAVAEEKMANPLY